MFTTSLHLLLNTEALESFRLSTAQCHQPDERRGHSLSATVLGYTTISIITSLARRKTIAGEKRAIRSRPGNSACLPSNRPSVLHRLPIAETPPQPGVCERLYQVGIPAIGPSAALTQRPVAATPLNPTHANAGDGNADHGPVTIKATYGGGVPPISTTTGLERHSHE